MDAQWASGARGSDGVAVALAGADAGGALDRGHPDLAVADLVGASGIDDGLDGTVGAGVVDQHLDAGLGGEGHAVLGAAVGLTVAALAAEALDLGDGHALDADLGEGGLHVL